MNKRRYRTLNEVEEEYFTGHPEEVKQYLAVALDEYQRDGDEKAFLASLAVVTKVKGGFTRFSKESGLSGDPKFSTVMYILNSLGLNLKVA